LEQEGERVSQKEAAVEALVARTITKEREAIEEQTQKVRAMAADLKRKDTATERERARMQALQRDLEARKASLEARDRAIREQEAQVERRREELRRMRAQIEELL
jgi:chromosome segregation ATPase